MFVGRKRFQKFTDQVGDMIVMVKQYAKIHDVELKEHLMKQLKIVNNSNDIKIKHLEHRISVLEQACKDQVKKYFALVEAQEREAGREADKITDELGP